MIKAFLDTLIPHEVNFNKIRLGSKNDGGYIILDTNMDKISALYSYGISNNIDFELAWVSKYNKRAHLYDCTIGNSVMPIPLLNFHSGGITGSNKADTLENQIIKNNDGDNQLFLKMNVEGCEWDVLDKIPSKVLNQFQQIVIEIHWLFNDISRKTNILAKLNEFFFLVHVHGNNNGKIKVIDEFTIVEVLELTYIRKDLVSSVEQSSEWFPTEIDAPNNSVIPDIILNFYPFSPFNRIYVNKYWGNTDKRKYYSGCGSDDSFNSKYVDFICQYVKDNNINSIIDLGCGDFRTGCQIAFRTGIKYIALDVSSEVIAENIKEYRYLPNVKFICCNFITEQIPNVEKVNANIYTLYTIRQVFQHLSHKDIHRALTKLKGYKHVLITDGLGVNYKNINQNAEIVTGRENVKDINGGGIRLELPPFNISLEVPLEYRVSNEILRTIRIKNTWNIVISLTTIPSRIVNLDKTINSLLEQTLPIDAIILNVPYYSNRLKCPYPEILISHPKLIINRCPDFGPATKILGTLMRPEILDSTTIIFLDDDRNYDKILVENLYKESVKYPDEVIVSIGRILHSGTINPYVDIFYGCCGVAVHKQFFNVNIFDPEVLNICRLNDDVLLAGHFTVNGIKIRSMDLPDQQRNNNNTIDALCLLEGDEQRNKVENECIKYYQDKYGIWK